MRPGTLSGLAGLGDALFYFVYTARLEPELMREAAPSARFVRVAHLPETRLSFEAEAPQYSGGLPSLQPHTGSTVWGAVFDIPDDEVAGLDHAEAAEGRSPTADYRAVDREGTSYDVITHVAATPAPERPAAKEYMELVVAGSRHWELPTGWIVGLEEYADDLLA